MVLPYAMEKWAGHAPCLAIVTARPDVGLKIKENACLAFCLSEPITLTFSAGVVVVVEFGVEGVDVEGVEVEGVDDALTLTMVLPEPIA